jgi:hypothetical protein
MYGTTRVHLIGSSTRIDVQKECPQGIGSTATYVPLWGVAVGILTFGILVPMNTTFACKK